MPAAHVVVGDLVSQATAWGVSDTELLGLLHVDPEVGRPQDDLAALAHRCAGLDGLETIDDVRRGGPELAEQLDRYLDTHGWRLVTGFDVRAPSSWRRAGRTTHGAILARELGIPAVVGARGATTAITDGSLVRVDALAGTIEVIGRPSAAIAESGERR